MNRARPQQSGAAPGPFALTHPDWSRKCDRTGQCAVGVFVHRSLERGDSGTGAATGSWVDKVYLSADSTLDASEYLARHGAGPVRPRRRSELQFVANRDHAESAPTAVFISSWSTDAASRQRKARAARRTTPGVGHCR